MIDKQITDSGDAEWKIGHLPEDDNLKRELFEASISQNHEDPYLAVFIGEPGEESEKLIALMGRGPSSRMHARIVRSAKKMLQALKGCAVTNWDDENERTDMLRSVRLIIEEIKGEE